MIQEILNSSNNLQRFIPNFPTSYNPVIVLIPPYLRQSKANKKSSKTLTSLNSKLSNIALSPLHKNLNKPLKNNVHIKEPLLHNSEVFLFIKKYPCYNYTRVSILHSSTYCKESNLICRIYCNNEFINIS